MSVLPKEKGAAGNDALQDETVASNNVTRNAAEVNQEINLPPRDEASRPFMLADLAKSGLTSDDIEVYPGPLSSFSQWPTYVIVYPEPPMYSMRIDLPPEMKGKYKGPKGITGIWWPLAERALWCACRITPRPRLV